MFHKSHVKFATSALQQKYSFEYARIFAKASYFTYTERQKKTLGIFRKDWIIFSKTVLNYKMNCISTLFNKEISILSHIVKSYSQSNFRKMLA